MSTLRVIAIYPDPLQSGPERREPPLDGRRLDVYSARPMTMIATHMFHRRRRTDAARARDRV